MNIVNDGGTNTVEIILASLCEENESNIIVSNYTLIKLNIRYCHRERSRNVTIVCLIKKIIQFFLTHSNILTINHAQDYILDAASIHF